MVTSVTPILEQQHMPRAQARAGGQDAHVRFDFGAYLGSTTSATPLAKQTPDQSHVAARNRADEYCCNQQYSVTAITTSTGTIAERYAYSAYGQPTILDASGSILSASAISNRYTYTGREWDATLGLHHFRARWMSAIAGRFPARDPMGFVDGSNVYGYVRDMPTKEIDPLGWAGCTPNWTGPCTLDNFRAWYRTEVAELQSWLPKVKPCPCNLSCFDPPYKYCFGYFTQDRVDYKICPTAPPGFMKPRFNGGYHPGMTYELRENNCPDNCQPGNQCTYDANGNLLTTPPAAGSADRYSGGCGTLYNENHRQDDVLPYDCAKQLDPNEALGLLDRYEDVRPTNGGKPCVQGPWKR